MFVAFACYCLCDIGLLTFVLYLPTCLCDISLLISSMPHLIHVQGWQTASQVPHPVNVRGLVFQNFPVQLF